jgi:hypothetical protein
MPRARTVKLSLTNAGEYYRKLGKEYPRAIQRGLIRGSARAVNILQQATEDAKSFDRGEYKRGWKATVEDRSARVFNAAPHAVFVEYGRRPGRMPPVDVLARWAGRKGLAGKGRGKAERAVSIGWAIAKTIAKHGLKGRFVFRKSLRAIREAMTFELKKAFDDAVLKVAA